MSTTTRRWLRATRAFAIEWTDNAIWLAERTVQEAIANARRHGRMCGRVDHVVLVFVSVLLWAGYDAFAGWNDDDE